VVAVPLTDSHMLEGDADSPDVGNDVNVYDGVPVDPSLTRIFGTTMAVSTDT
jgi:hypothetical protein